MATGLTMLTLREIWAQGHARAMLGQTTPPDHVPSMWLQRGDAGWSGWLSHGYAMLLAV